MVYSNFAELNANYPDREAMSFEEEWEYVQDAFDTYEALGLKEKFSSPYPENKEYDDMPFTDNKQESPF